MPTVVTTLKMGGTSAVLSRSYNTIPGPQAMRISAIQITRELLRTKGVTGLYRGLGATLMRWDVICICIAISHMINLPVLNLSVYQSKRVCLYFIFSGTSHSLLCTSPSLHMCTSLASIHLTTHPSLSIGPFYLAAWLDPLPLWLSVLVMVSD